MRSLGDEPCSSIINQEVVNQRTHSGSLCETIAQGGDGQPPDAGQPAYLHEVSTSETDPVQAFLRKFARLPFARLPCGWFNPSACPKSR